MAALSAFIILVLMLSLPASVIVMLWRTVPFISPVGAIFVHIAASLALLFLIASLASAVLYLRRHVSQVQLRSLRSMLLLVQLSRAQLVYWGWQIIETTTELVAALVHPFTVLGLFVAGVVSAAALVLTGLKYMFMPDKIASYDALIKAFWQGGAIFIICAAAHYLFLWITTRVLLDTENAETEVLTWLEKRQEALLREFIRAAP